MDTATAIGSVFAAFGLSGAAGLNAWLPLLAAALLARWDVVELADPFADLGSTTGLIVLAVLTTADFVGDKIPAVDHVLHGIGGFVAPASGAVLFAGQTGLETDLPAAAAAIAGALVAVAFLLPVLAFGAVLALLVAGLLVARRVRRALAGQGRRSSATTAR